VELSSTFSFSQTEHFAASFGYCKLQTVQTVFTRALPHASQEAGKVVLARALRAAEGKALTRVHIVHSQVRGVGRGAAEEEEEDEKEASCSSSCSNSNELLLAVRSTGDAEEEEEEQDGIIRGRWRRRRYAALSPSPLSPS
jgi:hypothetical protein